MKREENVCKYILKEIINFGTMCKGVNSPVMKAKCNTRTLNCKCQSWDEKMIGCTFYNVTFKNA